MKQIQTQVIDLVFLVSLPQTCQGLTLSHKLTLSEQKYHH